MHIELKSFLSPESIRIYGYRLAGGFNSHEQKWKYTSDEKILAAWIDWINENVKEDIELRNVA